MSPELKIKYIDPNLLKPYPNNPRTIGKEEMEGLKASLSKFGFAEPLAINKNNEVIGGNQRRQAAIELNIKEVPTALIVLPIKEERALNVELNNKHVAGDWTPALGDLLGQIKADDPELYESLQFEPLELDVPLVEIETDMPPLPDGDKEPFQKKTFMLHDDQAEIVEAALKKAKSMGPFVETDNENSNGNALARICEIFMGNNG